MKRSPIALFVYNRPWHTAQTIGALSKNNFANESELFIFSDGANNEEDAVLVEKTRDILKDSNGFKHVTIINREENIGLAENIISGITEIFKNYETVICLEDDLITSSRFLEFMNESLNFYKDKSVFSISGYTPQISIPTDYEFSTYNIMRNSSWGWATWKEKWLMVDWKVADFKDFVSNKKERKLFEQAGNDTTMMLLKQQQGKIHSWSIRFNYASFKTSEPTVYPTKSLIKNIGVDGSGTNMKKEKKYDTSLSENIDLKTLNPTNNIDNEIQKVFKKFYNTSLYRRVINIIKLRYYLQKT